MPDTANPKFANIRSALTHDLGFRLSLVVFALIGILCLLTLIVSPYLLPFAAIAFAIHTSETQNKSRRNSYLFLSTAIIPALILAMAVPMLDWQVYSPYGIHRPTATQIFYVLFYAQIAWLLIYPVLVEGGKWTAIGLSLFFIPIHLLCGFLSVMAISGTWL